MSVLINASTSTGLVQSADTSGEIELQSNGTTALKVNTNEGIQILNCLGVGNATPSTSGAGITFPATANLSSNANTFDDYEEGTWTPTVTSGSGSITSYTSSGKYTKIGNIVTIMFYVSLTTVGTAGGTLEFTNLPFTGGYGNGQIQPATTVRESNSTGNIYYAYVGGENTNGSIQSSSGGGAIAWGNNYKYSFVLTYQVV